MSKQLEIGKDYGSVFGLDAKTKGQHAYYLGGIKWRMEQPGKQMECESQVTTDNAVKYINQPSYKVGV